ncbi:aldose 1-epimerase family protein [Klebsormidium nitens]|uniref:glucose-6-phosphate 1-epimerase n=1 Tax=Klebsormidium nitens TaxID=105231 RepID=A0A1Y1IF09_KLENI|nr:aldose 1-epimerase family protein [Klebsormidium nitens]|eukprot:GAQ89495.1 aldose 1-epimerase family protein [Klebsormidium nitens]
MAAASVSSRMCVGSIPCQTSFNASIRASSAPCSSLPIPVCGRKQRVQSLSSAKLLAGKAITFSSARPVASGGGRTSIRAALSSAEAGIATSDVAGLSSKYGIPGSVSIEKGEGGSTKVVLKHESGAEADVYLFGAVVTAWRQPDGKDFLYVRPDAKFDGSKPISGGIPHCFPQFGPGEMQQHGFARNLDWAIVSTSADANPDDPEPMLELLLTDNEYTRKMWPYEFAAVYQVTLKAEALVASLRIINLDTQPFDFTAALHTYFRAAIDKVKVSGLKGLQSLNKDPDPNNPIESKETRDEVTFPGFVDVMYKDAPEELILDSGLGYSIALQSTGWKDAVTWSPYKTMESCYKEFVCVENAQLDPVVVEPGKSWKAELRLQPH